MKIVAWFKHWKDEIIVFSILGIMFGFLGWLIIWMEFLSPLARSLN